MHQYEGRILSYGAGVNSTALAILLASEGWRGPVLFSDTGSEWPETIAYLHRFRGWLAGRGLSLTILDGTWRIGKAKMPLLDYCEHYRLTPFPRLRWCTSKWKNEPLARWCKKHGYQTTDMMLGISAEEAHRQPKRLRPLVDRGIDRAGCERIITNAGLDIPRKSGCYVCPFQRKSQWEELYRHHPALFERVARLEEAATARRADGQITALVSDRRLTLRQLQATFPGATP